MSLFNSDSTSCERVIVGKEFHPNPIRRKPEFSQPSAPVYSTLKITLIIKDLIKSFLSFDRGYLLAHWKIRTLSPLDNAADKEETGMRFAPKLEVLQ